MSNITRIFGNAAFATHPFAFTFSQRDGPQSAIQHHRPRPMTLSSSGRDKERLILIMLNIYSDQRELIHLMSLGTEKLGGIRFW